MGQGTYLALGAVGRRLGELAELGRGMLLSNRPLMTASQSVILSLYGLVGLWAFLRRADNARRAAGLFVLTVCACFGIFAVLEEWFPSYRNDTAFVVLLTVLVSCLFTRPGRFARWAAWGFTLVLVGFAASNAAFTVSTMRINTVNALWAERIVGRLEALPDFRNIRRVALVGCAPCLAPNIPVAKYGINFHSGCVEWSRLPLLNQVSGYKWAEAPPRTTARPGRTAPGPGSSRRPVPWPRWAIWAWSA